MGLKDNIYKGLRISNDLNAISKNKVGRRIKRRLLGRLFSAFFRR